MGCCFSSKGDDEVPQPSLDERRRLQAEAAEFRLQQQISRGIADPESVERRKKKMAAAENLRDSMGPNESGLRWRVST